MSENLKYASLGDDEALLVIIFNALTFEQEDQFIRLLREHIEALGWTLVNIKRFSPTLRSHKITLELEAKPTAKTRSTYDGGSLKRNF